MNRLILRYGYPITVVILLVFAWVVARRLARGPDEIVPLAAAAVIVWLPGVFVFVYFWPRITVGGFKRAILGRGLGGGPIPMNTLYAVPDRSSRFASTGSLVATGADDLLYVAGWLDVTTGPQVLRVPAMAGRYYSVQFTDPVSGANFAYVGTRTAGTDAGAFLLSDPGWAGTVPDGMTLIVVPHRSALVIGRVFTENDDDRPAAHALAAQIRLTPLDDP